MFQLLHQTLGVSTEGALLPVHEGDPALALHLADGELVPLGVSSEECSAGVTGYSTIVNTSFRDCFMAHGALRFFIHLWGRK